MNNFKALHWTTGLWLAVLILAACNGGTPANVTHMPVSIVATNPPPTATPGPPAPASLPAAPTPVASTSTPSPLPLPPTEISPTNEAAPPTSEPGPANESVESELVQTQPSATWQTYIRPDDLQHYATALLIDKAGRKWIGGLTGLTVFDGQSWQHYTSASGLLYENVSVLAQDLAGDIWVGYSGGGLSRLTPSPDEGLDEQRWQHFSLATDAAGNTVIDLATDRAGRLWFSTGFDLGMFDGQSWTLYRTGADRAGMPSPTVEPPPHAPLIQPQVVTIGPEHPAYYGVSGLAADPAGPVWIANGQGLARFDGQQWQQYVLEGNHGNMKPMIVNAATGQVWGAYSSGGVSVFDGQNRYITNQLNGLPRDGVYAIAADPAGRVWFGSNAGVTVFDGQTWLTYTQADGLPSGAIAGIAVDPAGHIWLVTAAGALAEFTPPAAPAPLPTPVAEVVPRLL
ncbi:MAG: two-component regulator propeller domain-containing protein, partial [Anaerolineae bacterium]|nr:two-component regulator propeller domain-containing protein [Anaerolineae bacterium]